MNELLKYGFEHANGVYTKTVNSCVISIHPFNFNIPGDYTVYVHISKYKKLFLQLRCSEDYFIRNLDKNIKLYLYIGTNLE